jgi:hypothetical protein
VTDPETAGIGGRARPYTHRVGMRLQKKLETAVQRDALGSDQRK